MNVPQNRNILQASQIVWRKIKNEKRRIYDVPLYDCFPGCLAAEQGELKMARLFYQ